MQINKYRATIFFLLFLLLLLLLLSSTLGLFKLLLSSQYTYLFVQQILYSLLIVSPCFVCVLVVSARPLEIWSDRSFNAVEYFCYSIPIFPFNTSLVCSIFVCVCVWVCIVWSVFVLDSSLFAYWMPKTNGKHETMFQCIFLSTHFFSVVCCLVSILKI